MGSNATSVVVPAASNQYSDVAPCSESAEARTAGTGSVTANTAATTAVSYQLVGTITSLSAQSIGESFIAMAAAPSGAGQATLGNAFLPAATLMTLSSVTNLPTAGLPGTPFQLQALNEVVNVTAVSGTVLTVTRGYNGSTSYAGTLASGQTVTTGNAPGSGASNPHTADTFAHAGFQALALNTSDSISFTWNINITY